MTKELDHYVKIFYPNNKYSNSLAKDDFRVFNHEKEPSVMFIPHTYPESLTNNDMYKTNIFEAYVCAKLAARFESLLGIHKSKITILSFYKG